MKSLTILLTLFIATSVWSAKIAESTRFSNWRDLKTSDPIDGTYDYVQSIKDSGINNGKINFYDNASFLIENGDGYICGKATNQGRDTLKKQLLSLMIRITLLLI